MQTKKFGNSSITGPRIPLSRWADRQLKALAAEFSYPALSALSGPVIMGERGSNGNYVISGKISAGLGGSRLIRTKDQGWFALTLIRDIDRELLPALFGRDDFDINDWTAIAAAVSSCNCDDLLSVGRTLGLPVASLHETPVSHPIEILKEGPVRKRTKDYQPLVIDMSAIWAGPLAGHLLWQSGMKVVKVESRSRPDLIRRDDPATFDRINQGKDSILVDFHNPLERAALIELIRTADIVIESSRPRALLHLGIDAEQLVQEVPGLVWLSVTGHGAANEAAHWVGIGNDCGVAGGLSLAMQKVSGQVGYVGDAIADPLTGIVAAREAIAAYHSGKAQRIGLSMSAITAMALMEEQNFDKPAIDAELMAWAQSLHHPFPYVEPRQLTGDVRPIGADTQAYLGPLIKC